ncbi:unnamed protein product [Natator depressus]
MDIVEPLSKTTRLGKKYILVVVDFATRYPEAVALSSIEADTVADALLTIFSRVGFPKEVLTDQGSNFMSALLWCLWEKCGVRHIWASAYHPQSNGLVERFNGTLKMMLKTFMNQHPQDWDKYLPHLLFTYREVPQESTGISPFELLYGRRIRGPLDLMRDEWEGKATPNGESVVEYVMTFRERLAELMGLARENLARAQKKQKVWYDRTVRARAYATGDQVMVLIPVKRNKLQAAWKGLFKVVKQLNEVNYVLELSNRAHHRRVYHVNMMKPYYARGNVVLAVCGHCAYTNAQSLGNKQGELEVLVMSGNYDVIGITETWWDNSHDWSTVMDGYKLFRKDRQGRKGGGVALYVREQYDCSELRYKTAEKPECLWIKFRSVSNKSDVVVGVCYRPPDQGDEVDEAFFRQLAEATRSHALVLMGDFNFPDICWESNTAVHRQSRKFLESVGDNFLVQVLDEPTRGGAFLDLLLTNREELVGKAKVDGNLGGSDHEMVEFRILTQGRKVSSRIRTLDFRKADFDSLRERMGRIPWGTNMKGKGVQESWLYFKESLLRLQGQTIPMS